MWRGLLTTLLLLAMLPAQPSAQEARDPKPGAVTGRALQNGGPIAGVMITLAGPAGQSKAVTAADGTYHMENVRPGSYRLDAWLPGFRRVTLESVTVAAGQTITQDVIMRPAIFVEGRAAIPDGLRGALRDAAVVAHIEITDALGPLLINNESVLVSRYAARVLAVVKTDQPAVAAGATMTFDQLYAGRMNVGGTAIVGFEQPYQRGQSFVAFLRRNPDSSLSDLAGDSFMLPAAKGFVVLNNLPDPAKDGLRPYMPVHECLAVFRKILGSFLS